MNPQNLGLPIWDWSSQPSFQIYELVSQYDSSLSIWKNDPSVQIHVLYESVRWDDSSLSIWKNMNTFPLRDDRVKSWDLHHLRPVPGLDRAASCGWLNRPPVIDGQHPVFFTYLDSVKIWETCGKQAWYLMNLTGSLYIGKPHPVNGKHPTIERVSTIHSMVVQEFTTIHSMVNTWGFPYMGVAQNRWFIVGKIRLEWMIFGGYFYWMETSMWS